MKYKNNLVNLKINKIKFIIFLIFLIISNIYKKIKKLKICLCVIGKNENLYVKEFINHYKNLGYNHIFIYDNNDKNTESFSVMLKNELKEGFVSIIDYIGYKGKFNDTQIEAYYDCYNKNNREFNWLSFYDFDEYLELKPNNISIQEFLNNKRYKNCQILKINWLLYKSNKDLLYYENKPLQIRFNKTIFNNNFNKHIKSTVRGRLKKNYWTKNNNPHSSLNNYKSCSSSGKIVDSNTPFIQPPDYKYAFIKHFTSKSFEEFCLKLKRGWPGIPDNSNYINNLINENKKNIEKMKIIKKIFNLSKF